MSKVYKVLNLNKQIIGILLNTGRIIFVKPSKYVNDKIKTIDISFFTNANQVITNSTKEKDEQILYIKYKYEQSYILFKIAFQIINNDSS